MNPIKIIAEINSTCANLQSEKDELLSKVKDIDDLLTGYRMAIDALEMTMSSKRTVEAAASASTDKPVEKLPDRVGRRTILELDGVRHTVIEWAKILGFTPEGIQYRLEHGWSVRDTLTVKDHHGGKPSMKKQVQKPKKVFAYDRNGNVIRQYTGLGDASKDLNLPKDTVEKIITKMTKDDQLRVRDYYLAFAS